MKERILLHLIEYAKYVDELEVPSAITQEGIARETGIDVPHFTQYVRPLIQEGLVRERTAHVKGVRRRRKVYDLTGAGTMATLKVRDKLKSETVRVRDAGGVREATVSQVLQDLVGKASLLRVLRDAAEFGIVDIAALSEPSPTHLVEMIADAPRILRFVGRRAELEAIVAEDDGPRVLVLRGVAGIGKTALAGQACELLHGRRNLFWHPVRPWDTRVSLLASLGDFLAVLGKPGLRAVLQRHEAETAERVLREDLAGTRSLLVFDDAGRASPEALPFFRVLTDAAAHAPDVRILVLTRETLRFYDRRDVVLKGVVRELDLGGLAQDEVAGYLKADGRDDVGATVHGPYAGLPLFLELVRAHGTLPGRALRDVRRFLEEEVYTGLSDAERTMMKVASLYQVPVPSKALFADPVCTHDVLLSLLHRSLVREVSEERYEAHDTIRDFFAGLVSPAERERLGAFAVELLRRLAVEASEDRRFATAVDYLSNALRLATLPADRAALWESLGESSDRLGDVPTALDAYREAIKTATDPEMRARLHRRAADAYADRDEMKAAAAEVGEGFRLLGGMSGSERGHLELTRARILWGLGNFEEALEHGEASLCAFQETGDERGQALAYLELIIPILQWTRTQDQADREERYLQAALDLVDPEDDPVLAARARNLLAWHLAMRKGDFAQAKDHLAAIETIPGALDNPLDRRWFLQVRGWFRAYFEGDFLAAKADYLESLHLARQLRDIGGVSEAKYHLAYLAMTEGKPGEARRLVQDLADERMRSGMAAENELGWAGEFSLMEGNPEEFARIVAALNDPKLTKGESWHIYAGFLRAFDQLIQGDREGSLETFGRVNLAVESLGRESMLHAMLATRGYLYLGVALHVMGREQEAEEHIHRAHDIFRAFHFQGKLKTAQGRVRLLIEGLRRLTGE